MAHIKWLGVQGTLTSAISSGTTVIESDGLAGLPAISSPDIAYIVLDPNGVGGRPELVIVTGHEELATPDTYATVLRGQHTEHGGSTARSHAAGTPWYHAASPKDFIQVASTEAQRLALDVDDGAIVWQEDTQVHWVYIDAATPYWELLQSGLIAHLADTADAHDASAISFNTAGATPGSNLAATNVQTALEELDSEKQAKNASTTEIAAVTNPATVTIGFVIDGGGATITTGQKGHLTVPFACTLNQVTLLADQSGSIVVDIWKDTYANFPPIAADSITNAAKPTISAATKSQDSTLTGWTRTIAAGDVLAFNVDSITTCQRVLVSLRAVRA